MATDNRKHVIVISAHPDDAEIGMGGTIAKLASSGIAVISAILTDGRRSPNPSNIPIEEMIRIRKEEGIIAGKFLGVAESRFAGLPDLGSPENSRLALEFLRSLFAETEPVEIFTLHPELDRHATHRTCGEITRRAAEQSVPVWAYEVWGLFAKWDRFEDITPHVESKLSAIRAHRSQVSVISYDDGVIGLNRWRAVFADSFQQSAPCKYAEVFLKL